MIDHQLKADIGLDGTFTGIPVTLATPDRQVRGGLINGAAAPAPSDWVWRDIHRL